MRGLQTKTHNNLVMLMDNWNMTADKNEVLSRVRILIDGGIGNVCFEGIKLLPQE